MVKPSKIGEEPAGDILHDPVDAVEESLAGPRATPNGSPVPRIHRVELQKVPDLLGSEAAGDVLLVAEDQEGGTHELLLAEEGVELGLGVLEAELVGAVDDPDDPVGLLEVVAPVGADGLLAADVPDVELVGVVVQRLDVEAERGRDLVDVLPVELLYDRRLPRVVQPQHQQPHLLLLLLRLLHDRHEPHSILYLNHPPPTLPFTSLSYQKLFFGAILPTRQVLSSVTAVQRDQLMSLMN